MSWGRPGPAAGRSQPGSGCSGRKVVGSSGSQSPCLNCCSGVRQIHCMDGSRGAVTRRTCLIAQGAWHLLPFLPSYGIRIWAQERAPDSAPAPVGGGKGKPQLHSWAVPHSVLAMPSCCPLPMACFLPAVSHFKGENPGFSSPNRKPRFLTITLFQKLLRNLFYLFCQILAYSSAGSCLSYFTALCFRLIVQWSSYS